MNAKEFVNEAKLPMFGFLRLNRKVFQHFLWKEKRSYSRFEAWIDLISAARFSYDAERRLVKGKLIVILRGEQHATQRYLAKRWRWSLGKVNRFVKVLENEAMIERRVEHGETIVKLSNFELYNSGLSHNMNTGGMKIGIETDLSQVQTKESEEKKEVKELTLSGVGVDKSFEARKTNFRQSCNQLLGDQVEKDRFFNFYTHANVNGQMKWEANDFWSIENAFKSWLDKKEQYENEKNIRNNTKTSRSDQTMRDFLESCQN